MSVLRKAKLSPDDLRTSTGRLAALVKLYEGITEGVYDAKVAKVMTGVIAAIADECRDKRDNRYKKQLDVLYKDYEQRKKFAATTAITTVPSLVAELDKEDDQIVEKGIGVELSQASSEEDV